MATELGDQNREQLIALLADGEFHSGESLAGALGISRTAVWKRINRLADLGVEVESVHGKGYRLRDRVELLDERLIRGCIAPEHLPALSSLVVRQSVESTNLEALQDLEAGRAGSGAVYLAEQQTRGRGRRGRSWVSPYGRNIYLSLIWQFPNGVAALEGLSLALGVAVVRAIRMLGIDGALWTWPNDIVTASGDKLGGILCEMAGDVDGLVSAVIGIGINVDMPAGAGAHIDQAWSDLRRLAGRDVARNRLAAKIIEQCLTVMSEFAVQGFAAFREEWESLDAIRGREVVLATPAESTTGVAEGVGPTGALIISSANGRRTFSGGEVSVRRERRGGS